MMWGIAMCGDVNVGPIEAESREIVLFDGHPKPQSTKPRFQSLMEPGYSQEYGEKDDECKISRMKPGMLIEADTRDCTREEDAHSPSTEAPTCCGSFGFHPLGTANETNQGLLASCIERRFHKVY
jgi:hypothetical protein